MYKKYHGRRDGSIGYIGVYIYIGNLSYPIFFFFSFTTKTRSYRPRLYNRRDTDTRALLPIETNSKILEFILSSRFNTSSSIGRVNCCFSCPRFCTGTVLSSISDVLYVLLGTRKFNILFLRILLLHATGSCTIITKRVMWCRYFINDQQFWPICSCLSLN